MNINNVSIVNATPHAISITNGQTFEPSGMIARVSMTTSVVGEINGVEIKQNIPSGVEGIPAPQEGVVYIVSAMVLSNSNRNDLVAPNTNEAVRNSQGHIVSVSGFVK